jgi:glycosyltransferase involved in cell wall biosynthesis
VTQAKTQSATRAAGQLPVKVAFWAGSFERAGTQQFLLELLRRIDRERFDPVVMSTVKTGELLSDIESLDIEVHEFGTGRALLSPATIRGLLRAARFLRRERVAVLNCMLGLTTLVGPFVGRVAGVPVVLNNQRNLSYWIHGRFREGVYGFVNRRLVDAVLVNSAAAAAELVKRFRVPPEKVVSVGTGIDLRRIAEARAGDELASELGLAGRTVVGTVAKLSPVKGHQHFIAAAAEIAKARPDVVFLIVGDGIRKKELEDMATELGIADRVTFAGVRDDVPSLLELMDVFVLGSLSEGSPNAVLEAMAAGLPVVATDVGGLPEMVIDGESGILVPPGDSDALAEAIGELLDDPSRAETMGRAGLALAMDRHDIEKVVREVEGVMDRLLDASRDRVSGARGRSVSESVKLEQQE